MPEDPTIPVPPPAADLKGLDAGELLARGLQTAQPSAGAAAWEPPTPEELAKLLPQYRIESLLGRGGMGAVYKGVQAALDRTVAIKLLPAEVAANGDFLVRFQREARTLAKLQHSGIVAVYDFGQTGAGHLYFVMEYVDGTDLQHIMRGPGLRPEQAFVLIGQICEALHYAHQQGVIHRDIKPANILVTKDGRAKVADFGLARPLTEETGGLTQTNMVMGTPDYMAPEQRTGVGHPDHRADIFALGVMLYEMLTGQRPHGAFQPPSQRVQVDVRIDEVVLKALQQEPDRRYQQASEMKVDVDRIRTTPPEKVKPKRSRLLVATLATIGAVLILLAFPFALRFFSKDKVTGADKPESKAAGIIWNRVEHTEAEWQALGRPFKDGWVSIEHPESGKPIEMFEHRGTKLPPSSFAIRTLIKRGDATGAFVDFHWHGLRRGILFYPAISRVNFKDEGADHWLDLRQNSPSRDATLVEAVITPQALYFRINGGASSTYPLPSPVPCETMTVSGSFASVRDIEYANLDGIPDPLKALGWEVLREGSVAQSSLWKKASWSEQGRAQLTADGWFTVGDELKSADPQRNFGSIVQFADGAVRAQIRFETIPTKFPPAIGFWLRLPSEQSIQFLITEAEFKATLNGKNGAELGRVAFDTPFRRGDVEPFEAAAVGDRFVAHFKGKQLSFQCPQANRSGLITIHGRAYGVKDFEYAVLDGIPDPLKALGWEVPAIDVAPAKTDSAKDPIPTPAAGDVRTFAGHRYLYVPGQVSWPEAKAKAEKMGGHLATFENEAELQWVVENVARPNLTTEPKQMWVGGKKASKDTPWQWVTGEPWPEGLPMTENISKDPLNGSYPAVTKLLFLYHTIRLFDASDSAVGNRNWRAENIGFIVEWDSAAAGGNAPDSGAPATGHSGDPNTDQIVEWVFKNGGEVTVRHGGNRVTVKDPKQIPVGKFDLTEITMRGDGVTDEEFAHLGSVPTLLRISLAGGSRITSLKPLADLPQLRFLILPQNVGLAEEELAHLSGLEKLESLELRLPDATGESFRHLLGLKKLNQLVLFEGKLTEVGGKAIASLSSLTRLTLNHCIRDNQKALAPIGQMQNLRTLELVKDEVSAEGFSSLAGLNKLEKLNLSDSRIDNAGFALLTGSRGTLNYLNVDYNAPVSDEGIRNIVATFPNLEEINLSQGSTCTAASIRELAKLPQLKKMACWVMKGLKPNDYILFADLPVIERLSIENTAITDEALNAFAKCEHLIELHLRENAITDAGLKALKNIRPLKKLDLKSTKITPAGLADFQKARPDVTVFQ